MLETIEILLLITLANAAPVLASLLFTTHGTLAIDAGYKLKDGQYILGQTKTWRGLISSLLVTTIVASFLFPGPTIEASLIGILISLFAMSGDLMSSFIKRRLKLPSSTRVIFLDQIPESLVPALALNFIYPLNLIQVIIIVCSFIMIEMILTSVYDHLKKTRHS